MQIVGLLRPLVPPTLKHRIKRALFPLLGRAIEWEYVPGGWDAATHKHEIRGWDAAAVANSYRSGLPEYVRRVESPEPLGFWYEGGVSSPRDLVVPHNIHMSYAYALARASVGRRQLKVLDWGGAMGQYYALSRALFPELALEWVCKETPLVAEAGSLEQPNIRFTSDARCLDERFDFVVVSASLHYERDWQKLLSQLAGATTGYLYVTRLPVVQHAPSFVFIQRPYRAGYQTEYVSWCLNRNELAEAFHSCALSLVREFVCGENPEIDFAPENNQYRGYLLKREDVVSR